ncbi:MAG: ABC transporter permease [Bacteroidota bacterium]
MTQVLTFLLRRALQGLGVIWGIVSLLFVIFYALGDPTAYLVEDNADEATKAAIRAKYGLDQPLFQQYLNYLNDLSPIGTLEVAEKTEVSHLALWAGETGLFAIKAPQLGRSYQTGGAVASMVGSRLFGTALLAVTAIVLAALLGIGLGVIAALNHQTFWDKSILSLSVLGISAPSFFIGVLFAWLFAVYWGDWTGLNMSGFVLEENIFSPGNHWVGKNLLLPALALGIRPLAVFIQLTRSSMIEVWGQDYIRTGRAKGLGPIPLLIRHALRNALNPVMTSVTGWLASLLAGAFFIEYIFGWQGIGKLTIDALNTNDFPVIIACAMTVGLIFVGVSILTDLLYAYLDPRVKVAG